MLQRKTQFTYEELFKILLEECEERNIYLDPKKVHVDFEKAVVHALKNVFGRQVIVRDVIPFSPEHI